LGVANIIAKFALFKIENRGAYYRNYYPDRQLDWLKDTSVAKKDRAMELGTLPLQVAWN
jgi:aspartate oxidase